MGAAVSGSATQPWTDTLPGCTCTESRFPNGTGCKQGASWKRVASSTLGVVVHVASICHGAVHVTTRHTIGPTHTIAWLHWPYRKIVQPDFRLAHVPFPH